MDLQNIFPLRKDAVPHEQEPAALQPRSAWQIQRAVLFALLLRELKTRFGGRWLGAFWTLGEPLLHTLMMMLLYGYLRQRTVAGVDYVMYLISGLLPFFMFRNLALRLMDGIDANRALFGYRQVKPIDTLVSRAILEVGIYSAIYLIVLALLGWLGLNVWPDHPLELIAVSAALLAGGFGLGLTLAVLTNNLPQIRAVIRLAFFPLYILSGVIFPVHSFPADFVDWLLLNPVLQALELSRGFYFSGYNQLPQVSFGYVALFGLFSVSLGLSLYRVRRERLLAVQ
jgi:capsular polysaccharide transport system permease protein